MVSLGKRYTNHWLFTMLVKLLVGTVKIIELKGASISWEKNRASDVYSKTVRRNLVGPEMPPGVPIAIYIYIYRDYPIINSSFWLSICDRLVGL